ncbi:hypothetical protein [Niabella ginsengisoli]|uniref:Uncharacterized protein n=1 Tax=Niabella ginsengisoli TaxID=522298 RepID=A0ABS9SPY4_9BACT|nr:hypothetical protein [Niabella ginsengisoli]MCH5600473.1 hypothetical protein [Niabella ginsengisoli]
MINISLKRDATVKAPDQDSIVNTSPERKLLYSKILKKKIKEISTAPTKDNDGFIIKPLPQ